MTTSSAHFTASRSKQWTSQVSQEVQVMRLPQRVHITSVVSFSSSLEMLALPLIVVMANTFLVASGVSRAECVDRARGSGTSWDGVRGRPTFIYGRPVFEITS